MTWCTSIDAQLLNEYSEHEVNIYEKNDYPGGHTNTAVFNRTHQACQ